MKDKVLSEIKKYNLIDKNDNIIIGVSGGPDSIALLYVLLDIRSEIEFNIHIAHVNHGVRGEDALYDQSFVEKKAKELNLPYYTKNVNMIRYAKKNRITSEEAGRELRYSFFRDIIKELGRGKIAVAHNKNDQAETLIMRFMRGTGIDGLKGMEFIAGDIIRPILSTSREEVEKYIDDNGIETVLDKTNLKPIYNRNKVRLELIPYIQKNFNPNIIGTMWRTSEISSLDSDFLHQYTEQKYKEILRKENLESVVLDANQLLKLHASIQQRIIRNSILKINNSLQGITETQVSSALEIISKKETGKEFHLSNNILVKTNYDDIIIMKRNERQKNEYFYELSYPGVVNLDELGYSFYMEIFPVKDYFMKTREKNARYFDLDKINGSLGVRNRKNGDRFVPFGMNGSKKLKDYFIDEKISKDLRDKIPLIVDKESILWVLGYRTDERYRITEKTENVLMISYRDTRNT